MSRTRHSRAALRVAALLVVVASAVACPPPPPPIPTPVAVPVLQQQFKSTSGKTVLQYYEYSGSCPATTGCPFRGVITTQPGFTLAEVFLTGFTLESKVGSGRLQSVAASVQKFTYDDGTGAMEVGVTGTLNLNPSQPYNYRTTFVVVLTDTSVARFTKLGNGCNGVGSCHIVNAPPNAVPAGMQYIGFASRMFFLGSNSGPLQVNTLGALENSISVTPPSVQVDYICALRDSLGTNRMFCEWNAAVIAFAPSEMARNASPIFPQYTFLGTNTTTAKQWTEHGQPAGNVSFTGLLTAFGGAVFQFPAPQVNPLWKLQLSADSVRVIGTPPNDALADYGIFLGSVFGTNQALGYLYQESRAVGFLR